jgi:hypothetical protein
MTNPLINYDGVEREMTNEEWETHQAYQLETSSKKGITSEDEK